MYTRRLEAPVGTWLSLVEHSLGVRGVGSSNLPVPTIDGAASFLFNNRCDGAEPLRSAPEAILISLLHFIRIRFRQLG